MKRTLTWFGMILLIASAASATVVGSWDAPNEIWGLTSDGTWLWAGQDDDPTGVAKLMKLDPEDGSIVDQYDMPGEELRGIAWDGESIWVYSWRFGSTNVDTIYQVDPADGTILSTIQTPFASNNYAGGMTFYDGYLWITRYYPDDPTEIHKVDPATGQSVATLTSPHSQPEGITHDGASLWMVGDYFGGAESILYQLNPETGEVLHQEYPLGEGVFDTRTYDLTYDGSYFYLVTKRENNYALRSVYKLQIGGGGQPEIEVTGVPVDFGEIYAGTAVQTSCLVANNGTANLVFTASTTEPFGVEEGPFTILPGNDYILPIGCNPITPGEVSATVTLSSNDPVTPEFSFDVTANIIELPTPEVEFDPESIVAGWTMIPTFEYQIEGVLVTNVGDSQATLVVDSLVWEGVELQEDFYTPSLPGTLEPDANGELTFDFEDGFFTWLDGEGLLMGASAGTLYLSFEENPFMQVQLPCNGSYLSVDEEDPASPMTYALADPYPNPFNAGVRIGYSLPNAGEVKIQIVDILGHQVRTLFERQANAGRHEIFWNGTGADEHLVASGTYFIQMQAGDFRAVKRVQFVK